MKGTARSGVICIGNGFYEGLEWPLDHATTVVGRGRTADLVLAEATISRAHALFGYEDSNVFVQDLGSTNGTVVNSEKVDRKGLNDGDEIQIGGLVLRFSLNESVNKGEANAA